MNNTQKQRIISALLGDGYLGKDGILMTSSIHEEYIQWQYDNTCGLFTEPKKVMNGGYKKSPIYKMASTAKEYLKEFNKLPLKEAIKDIDELGLALWFYDDGSRHKKNNFYNINTHSFSREEEENTLIPLLNKFDIYPIILTETKKDGRKFSYLQVSKWKGACEMSRLMRKLNLKFFDYKLLPKEVEDVYFSVKGTPEFEEKKNALAKTLYIKKLLNTDKNLSEQFPTPQYINSSEIFKKNK